MTKEEFISAFYSIARSFQGYDELISLSEQIMVSTDSMFHGTDMGILLLGEKMGINLRSDYNYEALAAFVRDDPNWEDSFEVKAGKLYDELVCDKDRNEDDTL